MEYCYAVGGGYSKSTQENRFRIVLALRTSYMNKNKDIKLQYFPKTKLEKRKQKKEETDRNIKQKSQIAVCENKAIDSQHTTTKK